MGTEQQRSGKHIRKRYGKGQYSKKYRPLRNLRKRCESVEIGTQGFQLAAEVSIATVNQGNTLHIRRTLSGQRRNQMTEATTQIRHVDVATGQRSRSENHRGMLVVALLETARQRTEAFTIQLNRGTHLY